MRRSSARGAPSGRTAWPGRRALAPAAFESAREIGPSLHDLEHQLLVFAATLAEKDREFSTAGVHPLKTERLVHSLDPARRARTDVGRRRGGDLEIHEGGNGSHVT